MPSFSYYCAILGCPLRNIRWSWCAKAPDGSRTLFTIWDDQLAHGRFVLFPTTERIPGAIAPSANSCNGAREIERVAQYASDNPGIPAYGIICVPHDPDATPRRRESFDSRVLLRLRVEREGENYVAYSEGELFVEELLPRQN